MKRPEEDKSEENVFLLLCYTFFLSLTVYDVSTTGTKVEGILRQSADVEEVDHRVQEYEQGIFSFQLDDYFRISTYLLFWIS